MRELIKLINEAFPEVQQPDDSVDAEKRRKRLKVPRGKYKPVTNQPTEMGEVGRELRKRSPKGL